MQIIPTKALLTKGNSHAAGVTEGVVNLPTYDREPPTIDREP